MDQVFLKLCNVVIKVETNNKDYLQYLLFYFKDIVQDPAVVTEVELNLIVKWVSKRKWKEKLSDQRKNMIAVGGHTFVIDREVSFVRKIKRKIIFSLISDSNHQNGYAYIIEKKAKDYVKYKLLRKPEEEFFFELTYPLIYYPLFWYLEQRHNKYLLHASAFESKGKGIIICGLEGIGKTTLSLALNSTGSDQFLSDNLVLHDMQYAYGCYELLRLHSGEDKELWDGKFSQVNEFRTVKNFYRPKISTTGKVDVDIVLFPSFGQQYNVTQLTAIAASNKAVRLSYLARELEHYFQYRNVYALLEPNSFLIEQQRKSFLQLIRNAMCYEVVMRKEDGFWENVSKVKEVLSKGHHYGN
ncbi:hypothetical protein ACFL3D_03100 [Candidatus Omnitrophota bacterium]